MLRPGGSDCWCNSLHILGEISWMPYFNHGANYRVMCEL